MPQNDTDTSVDPGEDATTYAYKPSLISAPNMFRLTVEALDWQIGRHSGRVPYRDISRIRLSFRPVSMQTHRFQAEIWPTRGPKLVLVSTSWRSLFEQERHDEAYDAFLIALHRRIAAAGGTPLFQSGSPALLYWPGVAVFAALLAGLAGLMVRALAAGEVAGVAFLGVFFAIFLWQIGGFFRRNKPGTYRAGALPAALLPASRRTTSTEHLA